jgi:hypothetical protein
LRSLFLVSLPRSLSSLLYQRIRPALGLREPVWTSDGEILNLHRFAHLPPGCDLDGLRFTPPEHERFDRLTAFLDQATVPEGFFYKDVVQPFVVARWLPASGLAALRIERPLADVALAMLDRGWLYPQAAVDQAADRDPDLDPETALLAGLARAQEALAAIPGPVLRFDDLIADEEPLAAALRELYGDVPAPRYLDEEFKAVRAAVLARRRTERWERLAARSELRSPACPLPP